MVQGLGETLVGNFPGSAFSFVARKDQLPPPYDDTNSMDVPSLAESGITIVGYPSKSVVMWPAKSSTSSPNFIFRSDSNGEDLEGYACQYLLLHDTANSFMQCLVFLACNPAM